jgi:PAS domain S-box-containing protein
MNSTGVTPQASPWLLDTGPKKLEALLRSIVYQPAEPILVAYSDRNYKDASCGAARLFGVSRDRIIGRKIDDFAETGFTPQIDRLWREFLQRGEQQGTLRMVRFDGSVREVEYTARGNVLPVRHVLALREKSSNPDSWWVCDYALLLLDPNGRVAAWYSGAERIYGYTVQEIAGEPICSLYPGEQAASNLREELKRASAQGHFGTEQWHLKKDGQRFWANVLTMGLRDENGELQGYARVVRDFGRRRALHGERTRRGGVAAGQQRAKESSIAGVVSGEFDRITEANDVFLQMVGYSREDLAAGVPYWPDLTPAEYLPLDEEAHEEGMRYGACTPFEKQYIRKDGTRVGVLVAVAVLNLSPFRWISIVQVLSDNEEAGEVHGEDAGTGFAEIVGRSAALKRIFEQIQNVASTDATVLILGETGTGKELIAQAIHRLSLRRDRPFITLNCAAIPTGLLESELFGYERGAFTGALQQKIGRFEMANHGTLFLDEVGDISMDLQPKLLRALQEKSFERLGATKTISIDVRLLAATNRNLTQMMEDKLFRSDLYYRLKVFPITIPPLRDRAEDIPALAWHFLKKYAEKMGRVVSKIPSETMRALVSWPWPGNVRELENFIERAVILSPGPLLRAPLAELRADAEAVAGGTLAEMERAYIVRVLRETNGVVSAAAARLGLPRTTLNATMRKLGISRDDLS